MAPSEEQAWKFCIFWERRSEPKKIQEPKKTKKKEMKRGERERKEKRGEKRNQRGDEKSKQIKKQRKEGASYTIHDVNRDKEK